MVFSKSLGYAVRSLLYIALEANNKKKVQLNEIALKIEVPRYFLAKIMKKMVKEKMLDSKKGPNGGFYSNDKTRDTTLAQLMRITGEHEKLNTCVLKFKKCNAKHPCPMHNQVEALRKQWNEMLLSTTVGDLLSADNPDFLHRLTLC
jgi:Rrf2 family transcriptional regulator, iron-sulfur cluster assembly transcription factor